MSINTCLVTTIQLIITIRLIQLQLNDFDAIFFTPHCSSSLSCINEYLAINSGGYVYDQLSHIKCGWMLPREVEMVFD